jgi:hypothetical protein
MKQNRKKHSPSFKSKVAMEAQKDDETIVQLASRLANTMPLSSFTMSANQFPGKLVVSLQI